MRILEQSGTYGFVKTFNPKVIINKYSQPMPAKTTHKAKAIVQIDAEVKPLLDLMLKKANLSLSDLNDTFISIWVSQNKDLLTPAERQQYAHLFLHS